MLRTVQAWGDAVGFYRSCGFTERSAGDGVIEFEMVVGSGDSDRV